MGINYKFTSIGLFGGLIIFFLLIFNPIIKERSKLKKQHKSQITSTIVNEDNSIRLSEPLNPVGAKYISFYCLKEFGRTNLMEQVYF